MFSPEESRPLQPPLPQSPTTPRRPSPLSPFSSTSSRPNIARKVSEESRTLGRLPSTTSNGVTSEASTRSSSSSGSSPPSSNINPNPGTHLLRPARPNSDAPRTPSMILYQLAVPIVTPPRESHLPEDDLQPPRFPSSAPRPGSLNSRDSMFSMSSDSKYPTYDNVEHGYVAYAYDPMLDDDDDELFVGGKPAVVSWRGMLNVGMLIFIVIGLLALFVAGPVVDFIRRDDDFYGANLNDSDGVLPKGATTKEAAVVEPVGEVEVQRRYPIFIPEIRH